MLRVLLAQIVLVGLLASPLPGVSNSISGLRDTISSSTSSESTDTAGAGNSNPNVQDLPNNYSGDQSGALNPIMMMLRSIKDNTSRME